jgi:hypothetical protein
VPVPLSIMLFSTTYSPCRLMIASFSGSQSERILMSFRTTN